MASRKPKPLFERLTGPAAAKHGALPKVRLPGPDHLQREWNDSVGIVLKDKGLYRRDIALVTPFEQRLREMTPPRFISWCQHFFVPYKLKHDKDGEPIEIIQDMTESIAKITLADFSFVETVPIIHRIYPAPVPIINAADQLVLCTPGYDPSTGTFVFAGDLKPEPVAEKPDQSHLTGSDGYFDDELSLEDAVWYLYDLLREFPFADWGPWYTPTEDSPFYREDPEIGKPRQIRLSRSMAVQIGAMLALFAGGCVPKQASRMGFLFNATSPRSGKTLLAKLVTSPIYGSIKVQSWETKDEEMKKKLDSEVLAATPYIVFDNIRGMWQSQVLEGFMSAPMWTGRILGGNETFTAENHVLVMGTGNNVAMGTDMHHRTLPIDLYVEENDAQSRDIEKMIDDVWLADPGHRRKILSALWAIVRNWDKADRPDATGRPRNGFETWGRIIGGMVEFAGFGDMLAQAILHNAGDDEDKDVNQLVRLMVEEHLDDFTFQHIVHICWEHGLFPWLLNGREESKALRDGWQVVTTLALDGKSNSKFGSMLARHTKDGRGGVFTVKAKDGSLVKFRFSTTGQGRHKRFHVKLNGTVNIPTP